MTYSATPRTTPTRHADRATYDRATAHAVLDEALVAHLAFVVDGEPRVLPTLHVRRGETVYVHGSTGSRPMLGARGDGLPVCLAVTVLDGIVFAKSQFHHSANYRSVIVHGVARPVTDPDERAAVLAALVDKIAAGRAADSRPPSPRELAQTAVLAIDLAEVSTKTRTGAPSDDPADDDLPYWTGVLPLAVTAGTPQPAGSAPLPGYLAGH